MDGYRGVTAMEGYALKVEEKMKQFYRNLSEKDKRHYAAVEAVKLSHGGIQYLAKLFGCARQTIAKGLQEFNNDALLPKERVRRFGGGRKNYLQKNPHIGAVFLKGH